MKRILFIAPHSFPVSSSESICNSKVVYALAKSGYTIDVYTCVDPYCYPSTSKLDIVLRNSPNIRVYSVKKQGGISKTGSINSIIWSALRHLWILIKTGYFYNGITLPEDIIREINSNTRSEKEFPYDVMITRGFLTDYAGIYFARKKHIRWIANWNDPYPEEKFPYPYGKGNNAKLHFFKNRVFHAVQKYATIHSFPNERLRNYMLTCFSEVPIDKTCVIPHMALSALCPNKSVNDNVSLNIVSCGNIKKPRSMDLFLKALAVVIQMPEFRGIKVKCDFIGSFDADAQDLINKNDLSEIVSLFPPKSYDDCIDIIGNATISLIIEAVCEEGIYLPTKFVDAIQCETPVLCISPSPGVLQDYLNTYNIGYFAKNSEVSSIVEALICMFSDFKNHCLPIVKKESVPVFFENAIIDIYNRVL